MKKYLLYLLLAALLFPAASFAEYDEEMMEEEMIDEEMVERAELQLEMSNIQLEQQRAELDFNFEQQMRELEIEKARLEIESAHRHLRGPGRPKPEGPLGIILLIALLNRILVPIWIYKDMRQRDASSVILVLLGILGGLFGLVAYGVIRIGDMKAPARTARK